jgi:hypothetical protein
LPRFHQWLLQLLIDFFKAIILSKFSKSVNKSFIIQTHRADGARSGEKLSIHWQRRRLGNFLWSQSFGSLTLEDNSNNRLQLPQCVRSFCIYLITFSHNWFVENQSDERQVQRRWRAGVLMIARCTLIHTRSWLHQTTWTHENVKLYNDVNLCGIISNFLLNCEQINKRRKWASILFWFLSKLFNFFTHWPSS